MSNKLSSVDKRVSANSCFRRNKLTDDKLSINLFIYEFDPNNEKIENILSMQIRILNLVAENSGLYYYGWT